MGIMRSKFLWKLVLWALIAQVAYQAGLKAFELKELEYIATTTSLFIIIRGGKLRIFHIVSMFFVIMNLRFSREAETMALTLYYSSFALPLLPFVKGLTRGFWAREGGVRVVDPSNFSTFYQSHAWHRIRLQVFQGASEKDVGTQEFKASPLWSHP